MHEGDQHKDENYDNFRSGEESYSPGNRDSDVITEIVENRVEYLDSDKDQNEDSGLHDRYIQKSSVLG